MTETLEFQANSSRTAAGEGSGTKEERTLSSLIERFNEFTEYLNSADAASEEHFFRNPRATLLDARQHRTLVHHFLYKAGDLATDFIFLDRPRETAPYVAFLDAQIKRLEQELEDWHALARKSGYEPRAYEKAILEAQAKHVQESGPSN